MFKNIAAIPLSQFPNFHHLKSVYWFNLVRPGYHLSLSGPGDADLEE